MGTGPATGNDGDQKSRSVRQILVVAQIWICVRFARGGRIASRQGLSLALAELKPRDSIPTGVVTASVGCRAPNIQALTLLAATS